MSPQVILPVGWKSPVGYANGIVAGTGRMLYVAGQIGWDANQQFHSDELVPQFEQALRNVLSVVKSAGGQPRDICRITAFCIDKSAYLAGRPELGKVWKSLMSDHYPAMSMIFVADLLDAPAKIELEATAVIPDSGSG